MSFLEWRAEYSMQDKEARSNTRKHRSMVVRRMIEMEMDSVELMEAKENSKP